MNSQLSTPDLTFYAVLAFKLSEGNYSETLLEELNTPLHQGAMPNEVCTFDNQNSAPGVFYQTEYYYSYNYCHSPSSPTPQVLKCPFRQGLYNTNPWACLDLEKPSNINYGYDIYTASGGDTYITLMQTTYKNYDLGWNLVGVGGSLSSSFSSTISGTASLSKSKERSFSQGLKFGAKVSFKEGVVIASTEQELSIEVSAEFGEKNSQTMSASFTQSHTTSTTCNTLECDGQLYQWALTATDVSGFQDSVQDCFFTCVSLDVPYPPRCPLGACADDNCQCCNSVWWNVDQVTSDQNTTLTETLVSAGCIANGCVSSNSPCSQDSQCCSGRCDIAGDSFGVCAN